MTKFWTFFINKNHFTILLMVILVVAGFGALIAIPKESSPEIAIATGIVSTVLPGAGAQDVERLITDKIEDKVLGIARVSKVSSRSYEGASVITVEFDAGADIDKSIQLLKDEVEKVVPELPTEALTPTVTDINFADQPILIASISGNLAPEELTALGSTIQDELQRISGVSKVVLSGVREKEVQVIIEQTKLRQYNLTIADVTNALRASGVAAPIGSITVDGVSYAVRLEAGIPDTASVENISIAGPGGISLRVQDVATVVQGLENASTFSRVSVEGAPSQPALTLSVYKNRGGNVVSLGGEIKDKLTELGGTTLSGTKLVISYDASKDVTRDLTDLTKAGVETIILVLIVLFATLGWRESIVAAVSIPLSFLIAFLGLYISGNTINFISLFSLILAIGILVDLGIVVVEAIHTHLHKTGNKRASAIAAIKEYALPLIAGTFTTIAVFVPLFFLSGVTGKFIASIPFTVIFVLLASIFVALGLVPLLALLFIRSKLSPLEEKQEAYAEKAKAWYKKALLKLLGNRRSENRFMVGLAIAFVIALALPAIGAVKVVFFPGDNGDLVYIDIEKPRGTDLRITDLAVREVEELLYNDALIASFVSEVGSGNAFSGLGATGSNVGNVTINLLSERQETSAEIVSGLRARLSSITSATVRVSEPSGGPPSGLPVSITFKGDDMTDLTKTVENAARVLSDVPGTTDVTTSTRGDSSEFVIKLDSAKAAELGVNPLNVSDTLRTALFGTLATSIRAGKDEIEVRTKLDLNPNYTEASETNHVTIDAVSELLVPGKNGPVPLSTVADIEYGAAQSSLTHLDGERTVTLSSQVMSGSNAIAISDEFVARMNQEVLPPGVLMSVGGDEEDVNKTFTEMFIALIAGAALMLTILVLEFNSFRKSFYLLSLIPLSLIGVFFGLLVTGQPLSFPSMLGVIALSGVIINHAILLMDSIARISREHPSESLTNVISEAASIRLRPIVLTTVVTVVAMIPLSRVSPIWGPLAYAVMFGLVFSMILTLVLVPILYHRWPGSKGVLYATVEKV